MATPPPRLDTAPAAASGYAPVSWMAVAAVGVSGLFVLFLVLLGGNSFLKKQPLVEPWLLLLPAVGTVLAFTARRQIQSSEGTRTGLGLVSTAWWLSVLVGLGYVAYLFGIDFAVRNDAEGNFTAWADTVKAIDPADPRDPDLYEAVLRTVPPRARAQVRGAKDTAAADKVFRDELARLRQFDVVRIAGRNRGEVRFTGFGVKEWQQTPTQITCTLACKMVTPEGEHALVAPMTADLDKSGRQWQIAATGDGFIRGRELTRYGWLVEQVEDSGTKFAGAFLTVVAGPGRQWPAYQIFVRGDKEPAKPTPAPTADADKKDYEAALAGPLFALPGGAAPSADERARLRGCWEQGRVLQAGSVLRETPDTHAVLRLTPAAVEMRVPVELLVAGATGATAEPARGKLVIQSTNPALLAELAAARAAGGSLTAEPPQPLLAAAPDWRVVRIESDLKPVPAAAPPGRGGAGGPGGGPGE